MKNAFELTYAVLLLGFGGYWYFFPQRRVPSGNRRKIEEWRWMGLAFALIGAVLLALKLFGDF